MEKKSILITGGSGLVGKYLTDLLTPEYRVIHLSRNKKHESSYFWDPENQILDENHLKNHHAIIHLAGENIGSGRWTKKKKQKIYESRIQSTKLISGTLMKLPPQERPECFISASAVGYYGNRGDEVLNEQSASGKGFLSETVNDWEDTAKAVEQCGIRTVILRFGVVLSKKSGALEKMILPVRFFIGSPLGSGKQYISWIHIEDLAKMIRFSIQKKELNGVFNAVSPEPRTNAEFTKTLGKVMHRPVFLPAVPEFLLRALLGDMAEIVLDGQRVSSEKIQKAGFTFTHPDLESALKNILLHGRK